jgi:hypothetical protein
VGVFHDRRFEDELNALQGDVDRLDDALRYVEQRISEEPASGIQASVPGIFIAPIRLPANSGLVRVSIFYTFDGKDVTFRALRRAP